MTGAGAGEDPIIQGVRAHFKQHNMQAFSLAVFALAGSAALWTLIYGGVYWIALIAATVSTATNPATLDRAGAPDLLGRHFGLVFLDGALVALLLAALVRRRLRPERLQEERHYLLWLLAEFLMAAPNATFAIWGNLAAITRLRRRDAALAGLLLRRMDEANGRLDLAALPLADEDERALRRVVFRLQLVGLIALGEDDNGWYLRLEKRDTVALLCAAAAV
jgi:hypothetical protein